MQDYSKLYQKRYQVDPRKKLEMIRDVIRSGVSQTLMLAAIIMIVNSKR